MRVHLIHGIHTAGAGPISQFAPLLRARGFKVVDPDYGWIAGLETRIVNPIIRGAIFPYIEPGDICIGHSNGCAIIYDLMKIGAPIQGAVFINAALEREIVLPPAVRWLDVHFNKDDDITIAAQIAEKLHLVDPVWGEMGHAGYLGTDKRIANFDDQAGAGMPIVRWHSGFFEPANFVAWGPFEVDRIERYVTIVG